jgi:hypothetical protein
MGRCWQNGHESEEPASRARTTSCASHPKMMVQHPKGENATEGSKLVAIELYEISDEFAAHPVAHPGSLDIRISNFGGYLRRVYTPAKQRPLFIIREIVFASSAIE